VGGRGGVRSKGEEKGEEGRGGERRGEGKGNVVPPMLETR